MASRLLFRALIFIAFDETRSLYWLECIFSLLVASIFVHLRGTIISIFALILFNLSIDYIRLGLLSNPYKRIQVFHHDYESVKKRFCRLELGRHDPPLEFLSSDIRSYGFNLGSTMETIFKQRYVRKISQNELCWVKFINITNNRFASLPGVLRDFLQLQWIDASSNPILDVNLNSLQPDLLGLSLSKCNLTMIYWDMETTTNIRYLNLSYNILSSIPLEPLNAPYMEILDFSGNNDLALSFFQDEFFSKMPNLKVLILPNGSKLHLWFDDDDDDNNGKIGQFGDFDLVFNYLWGHGLVHDEVNDDDSDSDEDDDDNSSISGESPLDKETLQRDFIKLLLFATIVQPALFGIVFDEISIAQPDLFAVRMKNFPMISHLYILRKLPIWRHGFFLPASISCTLWILCWFKTGFSQTDPRTSRPSADTTALALEDFLRVTFSLVLGGNILGWTFLYRNPRFYAMQAFAPALSSNDPFSDSVALESSNAVIIAIVPLQIGSLSPIHSTSTDLMGFVEFASMRIWFPISPSSSHSSFAVPVTHALRLPSHGLSSSELIKRYQVRFGPNIKRIEIAFWPFFWNLILVPSNFFFLSLAGFESVFNSKDDESGIVSFRTFIGPILLFAIPMLVRAFLEIWMSSSKYDVFAMVFDLYRFVPLGANKIKVIRENNHQMMISYVELLPGDLVYLERPLLAPADMIILEGQCVVSEAMLTGESIPIQKVAAPSDLLDAVLKGVKTNLLDGISKHIIFDGTFIQGLSSFSASLRISRPRVKAIVLATGFSTRKGSIIQSVRFNGVGKFSSNALGQLGLITLQILILSIFLLLADYYSIFTFRLDIFSLPKLIFDVPVSLVFTYYHSFLTFFNHCTNRLWLLFTTLAIRLYSVVSQWKAFLFVLDSICPVFETLVSFIRWVWIDYLAPFYAALTSWITYAYIKISGKEFVHDAIFKVSELVDQYKSISTSLSTRALPTPPVLSPFASTSTSASTYPLFTSFSFILLALGRGRIYLASLFEFAHHVAMRLFSMDDLTPLLTGSTLDRTRKSIDCTDLSKLELSSSINVCCFDKTGTLTDSEMSYEGWVEPVQYPSTFLESRQLIWPLSLFFQQSVNRTPKMRFLKAPSGSDLASDAALVIGVCHSLFESISSSISVDTTTTTTMGTSTPFSFISASKENPEIFGSVMDKLPFEALGWELQTCSLGHDGIVARVITDHGVNIEVLRIFPKDSVRKRMVVVGRINGEFYFIAMKGAPDVLRPLLRWTDDQKKASYSRQLVELGSQGYRIMALGIKWMTTLSSSSSPSSPLFWSDYANYEDEEEIADDEFSLETLKDPLTAEQLVGSAGDSFFTFVGFVAFKSEPKGASLETLRELRRTDHRTVMITGDSMETAVAVGRQLEFFNAKKRIIMVDLREEDRDRSFDSGSIPILAIRSQYSTKDEELAIAEVEFISATKLVSKITRHDALVLSNGAFSALVEWHLAFFKSRILPSVVIFSRFTPDNKCWILRLYKELNLRTLMCGDGTNDVMALQQADIGVALLNSPSELVVDLLFERPEGTEGSLLQDLIDLWRKPFRLLKRISQSGSDLSVVAPFCSYQMDISCVLKILRLGRASAYYRHRIFVVFSTLAMITAIAQLCWNVSVVDGKCVCLLITFGLGSFAWDMMPGFFNLVSGVFSIINVICSLLIFFVGLFGSLISALLSMMVNPILAFAIDYFFGALVAILKLIRSFNLLPGVKSAGGGFSELSARTQYTLLLPERPVASIFNIRTSLLVFLQVCWHLLVMRFFIDTELGLLTDPSDGMFKLRGRISHLSFFMVLSVILTNYSGRPWVMPLYRNTPLLTAIGMQFLFLLYQIFFGTKLNLKEASRLCFVGMVDILFPMLLIWAYSLITTLVYVILRAVWLILYLLWGIWWCATGGPFIFILNNLGTIAKSLKTTWRVSSTFLVRINAIVQNYWVTPAQWRGVF